MDFPQPSSVHRQTSAPNKGGLFEFPLSVDAKGYEEEGSKFMKNQVKKKK